MPNDPAPIPADPNRPHDGTCARRVVDSAPCDCDKAREVDPSDVRALIDPADVRTLDRMADGHMVPVIEYGDGWEVETSKGETFAVPADVQYIPERIGGEPTTDGATFADKNLPRIIADALVVYMPEGCLGEVRGVTIRRGAYWARMSAPGYLDATDWEVHASAQSAADSLIDAHGDDAGEVDE